MSAQVIDFPSENRSSLREMGSPEWTRQWQLNIQSCVKDLMTSQGNGGVPYSPLSTRCLLDLIKSGNDYQAWTSLTDKEGKTFKRFRDFCEYRRPWGLGVEYDRLSRYLKDNLGEKAVAVLIEVNPDNTPGGDRTNTDGDTANRTGCGMMSRSEQANKAIGRSPETIKQLYIEGCIGQKEAAKFGPYLGKNPNPEKESKKQALDIAAGELERWVKENPPPELPIERQVYQQKVNKEARRLLGMAKQTLVFSKDEPGSQIASKLYQKLTDDQLKELLESLLNFFNTED